MPTVDMTEQDWQFILNFLATKLTWAEANPYLMKIGAQLQQQQPRQNGPAPKIEAPPEKRKPQ
jgi:hypothetical protein